jgi:hypothetical protein
METKAMKRTEARDWFAAIAPGLGVMLVFSLGAYWLGKLPDFYHGEDFYLFHFAETHTFREAVNLFFLENGRFFEAVYWTALYKALGYQPALQHLVSLILNLLATLAASFAVYRAWPRAFQRRGLITAFVLLVFFNPYTTKWALTLSGDNSRISIILFFLAVICVQQWVISKFKHGWFALGFFLFVISVFNYENVALLFPVAYLLSYPLVSRRGLKKSTKIMAGVFALVSVALPLLPILLYSGLNIVSHPALRGEGGLGNPVIRIVAAIKHMGLYFFNSADPLTIYTEQPVLRWLPLFVLVTVIVFVSGLMVLIRRRAVDGKEWLIAVSAGDFTVMLSLYVASLWLIFLSVVPYAIAYQFSSPYVRFFAISIYGFAILLILGLALLQTKILRVVIGVVTFLIVLSGLVEFNSYAQQLAELESSPRFDYLSIIEVVPRVEDETVFFMVDFIVGTDASRSCALPLQMLYDVKDLRCGFISSNLDYIQVERTEGVVATTEGGRFLKNNWILIGINEDGSKYIIPEIGPDDPYFIDWQSEEPIQTSYLRIASGEILETSMYRKLVERSLEP